ncbi:MAG: hypothetical protein M3Y08_10700 [Fibrobacterota bacterium]|nr:hypothetical protein [Fibrobacterota bacterium]
MTLQVSPHQQLTTTPSDSIPTATGRASIYGFTYASNDQSDGNTKIDLDYFIPKAGLPKTGLPKVAFARIAAGAAAVDGAGISWGEIGKTGADVTIGTIIDAAKDKGVKVGPLGSIYALASAASNVAGAMDLAKQNGKWLAELDALEKCAANPTNQVSKSDPNYSKDAVAKLHASRSELKEVNAVRFLNQMTETGSGIIPATAVLSVGLKQGFLWNEQTLGDYSENTIMREARLMVVKCEDPGKLDGNVDVVWECTIPWGSQVDHKITHAVTSVTWVWSPMERKYIAEGQYTCENVKTVTGSGRTCTTKGSAGGSLEASGRLMIFDDPALQAVFGFGYSAAGQIVTYGTMSDDRGGTYPEKVPLTINWLPNVTGFPGTGGSIEGERTNPSCVGGSATGSEKIKYQFSVPPAN